MRLQMLLPGMNVIMVEIMAQNQRVSQSYRIYVERKILVCDFLLVDIDCMLSSF